MNRPTWNNFIGKNFDDNRYAMEALARLLFRTRYGIGDSLPYFKNHAGNETEPIEHEGEIIGFQSKFFEDCKIDADQIMHSLEKVCEKYPNQNRYIIYTNGAFGNPQKGHEKPVGLERLEKKAADNNITLEWVFGENVLDLVQNNELAYNVFFNPQSNLHHLQEHTDEHNRVELDSISNSFKVGSKDVSFDRSSYINKIAESIANNKNLVITGESGSGKSAIVKRFCQSVCDDQDYAIFVINAGAFAVNKVNDVFNLSENYTLGNFSSYFDGHSHKLIIIDSAEKLLELDNTSAVRLFIDHLKNNGWLFIFTCKDNVDLDFLERLESDFQLDYETIKVKSEEESNIRKFALDNGIKLPVDSKLFKEIRIPFYFARYCELSLTDEIGLEEFRNRIWRQKVCGVGSRAEQKKRELCMFDMVSYLQHNGAYVAPYNTVDIESASQLVDADVLGDYPNRGYFVKHDIYTDWSLDIQCTIEFEDSSVFVHQLTQDNSTIQYINAFKRWLLNGLNSQNQICMNICDLALDDSTTSRWRQSIFECIGRSDSYASIWMQKNNARLLDDNYKFLNEFIDILVVTCMYAEQHFTYEGRDYPLMKPIGSGWEASVELVWKNVDDYYLKNLPSVLKLISNFSGFKNADPPTIHHAGLLALRIFDIIAESRKNNESFWFDRNGNKWAELVCKYSLPIKDEIKDRLQQVIENKWYTHRDPYAELIEHILKKENSVTLLPLCFVCMKELISLLELCWSESDKKNDDDYSYNTRQSDYAFGLNRVFLGSIEYFPCSALQTPIYTMLNAENMLMASDCLVIDFLIRFIDERVNVFAQRGFANERIRQIIVTQRDGSHHEVIVSECLWNIYRGTSGLAMPNLIESIHMALEKFLLELADKKENTKIVDKYLWHILENSHSCSMYAIVASIASAHISEYIEQLLFLMQDINFLSMDLMRHTREFHAESMSFAYYHHKELWNERHSSNTLKHRSEHLEQLLFKLQVLLERSKNRQLLDRVYAIVDSLKLQVSNMKDEERSLAKYIILRIDARSMSQKDVEINGTRGVEYSTVLTPEMEKEQETMEKNNQEMMKGMSLHMWIDLRYKGKTNESARYAYDTNHTLVLDTIRDIRKQLDAHENGFSLITGDQYLPFTSSAILLTQFRDVLSQDELAQCQSYLMEALNAPEFILESSLSGFDICVSAIPCLIENIELQDDVLDIIVYYAQRKRENVNNRPCDLIYNVIKTANLWSKYPALMEMAIEKLQKAIGVDDLLSITKEQAESLFCLLSSNTSRRDLGEMCMGKLSEYWKSQVTHGYNHVEGNLYLSYLLADYWIEAPCEEIPGLVAPFKGLIHGDLSHDNIVSSLVYKCAYTKHYSEFWIIWDELYEGFVNNTNYYYYSSVLCDYLLNPSTLVENPGEWFDISKEDITRFARIAHDMGSHPSVLYSVAKVFATIGHKFQIEILPVLNELVSNPIREFKDATERNTIYNLEQIMDNVFPKYLDKRRVDKNITEYVVNVLKFMQKHGSTNATDLLTQI